MTESMTCDISARVRTSQILPRQHANAWQRPAIENHCQVASTEDPQRQVTGADPRYIDAVFLFFLWIGNCLSAGRARWGRFLVARCGHRFFLGEGKGGFPGFRGEEAIARVQGHN